MISQTVLFNWWSKSHMVRVIVYSTFFWDNVFSQWQQWDSSFPFSRQDVKKPHSNVNFQKVHHGWGEGLTWEKHLATIGNTWLCSCALTTRTIASWPRMTHTWPHLGKFQPTNSSRTAWITSSPCGSCIFIHMKKKPHETVWYFSI